VGLEKRRCGVGRDHLQKKLREREGVGGELADGENSEAGREQAHLARAWLTFLSLRFSIFRSCRSHRGDCSIQALHLWIAHKRLNSRQGGSLISAEIERGVESTSLPSFLLLLFFLPTVTSTARFNSFALQRSPTPPLSSEGIKTFAPATPSRVAARPPEPSPGCLRLLPLPPPLPVLPRLPSKMSATTTFQPTTPTRASTHPYTSSPPSSSPPSRSQSRQQQTSNGGPPAQASSSSRLSSTQERPLSMASFRSGIYEGEADSGRRRKKPRAPVEVSSVSSLHELISLSLARVGEWGGEAASLSPPSWSIFFPALPSLSPLSHASSGMLECREKRA